jgi:hypothetical protein
MKIQGGKLHSVRKMGWRIKQGPLIVGRAMLIFPKVSS